MLNGSQARSAGRLVAFALAVASLYAVTWGLIYVTVDRSSYLIVARPDGTIRSEPPGVPYPAAFPDPGTETEPLAAAFLIAGAIGLAVSVRLGSWARRAEGPK